MHPIDPEVPLATGEMNWYLSPSDDGQLLYFVLLRVLGDDNYVCQLDLKSKTVKMLRSVFPAGIDVDRGTGVVYTPRFAGGGKLTRIDAQDFEGKVNSSFQVSHRYTRADLSPNRKKLLLTMGEFENEPPMAVLDLSTGKEDILPGHGSYAAWASASSIFFVRGSRELWRYTLGDPAPSRVMAVDGKKALDKGGYAAPPVCSRDGTWVAWQWAAKDTYGDQRMGTVLIDLHAGEYRRLDDDWWHNVAWGN